MQYARKVVMDQALALKGQLKVWADMSAKKHIPYVRAIQAARLLASRYLLDIEYGKRYTALFEFLLYAADAFADLRMHWIEKPDGTKWLYFCEAEPLAKRRCEKCRRRLECLSLP